MHWKEQYQHCVNCYEMFDVRESEARKTTARLTEFGDVNVGSARGPRMATSDNDGDTSDSVTEPNGPSGDCVYHDGYLNVDDEEDQWADHDEDCHGTIDSMELRKEYPEKYVWDCCDDIGNVPGCKRNWHQQGPKLRYYAQLQKADGM